MQTLNLGIVAHVDAGKTSLTERLLYAAGVIDQIGSVDEGSTQTDTLALERQRGITIKSAVVSFVVDGVTVNLIDTPGHPDFIAEVERVLRVLDGAVLVVSAVEGVQAQTRVLLRTLRRLRIPTLVFVNKIDRAGARHEEVLRAIADRLTPAVVPMGTTDRIGTRTARFIPYPATDAHFTARLAEVLADHDDALLAAYVQDEGGLPPDRLRAALVEQTGRALVHPVFFGSAMTGAGVPELVTGITGLLPAAGDDPAGPAAGAVFKVERGPAGEKIAYLRMFSGTVRVRERIRFDGDGGHPPSGGPAGGARCARRRQPSDGAGKITAISVFDRGAAVPSGSLVAGQIGRLWGLAEVRVGDTFGAPCGPTERHHFAPPTLETVVLPCRRADRGALHAALVQLAEQDPLINVRQDDIRREISVSLYGEVQKEVIQATLADEYGLAVTFQPTTTICVERPAGTGTAVEIIKTGDNPFLATVGLRVEPAPVGAGVRFRLGVELGSMPLAFFKAVEETVHETLRQGLYGWQVVDCVVTMTRAGYWARQSHAHGTFDKSMSSTAGDFRNLTPLVLMAALRRAGTVGYEPMHRFRIEAPADTLGALLPVLAGLRAVAEAPITRDSTGLLEGEMPAAGVHELRQRLPALTRGEGLLDCAFHRYQPVRGEVPRRSRSDHDPLNRKEYLLAVVRRVPGHRAAG